MPLAPPVRSLVRASALALLVASACSPQSGGGGAGGASQVTARRSAALLGGAGDVTGALPGDQSETALYVPPSGPGGGVYGYNAPDPARRSASATTLTWTKGLSYMGFSFYDNNLGWQHGRLAAPTGWAVLRGDPALTGTGGTVYYSDLAISNAQWTAVAGTGTTITDTAGQASNIERMLVNGACIFRSSNGGQSFALQQCITATRSFDGGSLAVVNNQVFAAYVGSSPFSISEVYRATSLTGTFSKLADPFPTGTAGHPQIQAYGNGSSLVLAVLVGAGANRYQLKMIEWDINLGAWGPAVLVADFVRPPSQSISVLGGNINTGRSFDFACGNQEARTSVQNPVCRFAVSKVNAGGGLEVQVVACEKTLLGPWSCSAPAGWLKTAPTGSHNYFPSIAVANVGGATPSLVWGISVWKYSTWFAGRVAGIQVGSRLQMVTLQFNNTQTVADITSNQRVCPSQGGYVGDYDYMRVVDQGTPFASFFRGFTDSTASGCFQNTFDSGPRHVSEIGVAAQ